MVLLHFNKNKKKETLDTLRPSAEIKPGKKRKVAIIWRQTVTPCVDFCSSFSYTESRERTLTFLASSIISPSSSTGAQMRLLYVTGEKESSVSLKSVPKTSQKVRLQR